MLSIKDSEYENVKTNLKNSLDDLGGIKKFVEANEKVLIKPNLCNPVRGAVTDARIIKAMIELTKEITPNVYVGDLPAITQEGITKKTLSKTGIMEALKATHTKYADMANSKFVTRNIKDYRVFEKTDFAISALYVDVIINMPKLKTHGLTYITGAVKNLFGLIPMSERQYLHGFDNTKFSQGVLDIYAFLQKKVKLNVMDAIEVMEGDEGPVYGPTKFTGKVLTGDDAIEMDWAAAKLTGHEPEKILTNKLGVLRGIGKKYNLDIELVEFKKHTNYCKKQKLQPFISDSCQMCGECQKICPAEAIEKTNTGYRINNKCIKCYCCLESCKYKAIYLY